MALNRISKLFTPAKLAAQSKYVSHPRFLFAYQRSASQQAIFACWLTLNQ